MCDKFACYGRSTDGVASPRCFRGDDLAPKGNVVKKDDSSPSAHIKLWKRAQLSDAADAAPQQQSKSKTN